MSVVVHELLLPVLAERGKIIKKQSTYVVDVICFVGEIKQKCHFCGLFEISNFAA